MKIEKRKIVKLVGCGFMVTVSACSSVGRVGGDFGGGGADIMISATRDGMEAWGDHMTGLITTGKASPDVTTAHHQMRNYQEDQETRRVGMRYLKPQKSLRNNERKIQGGN